MKDKEPDTDIFKHVSSVYWMDKFGEELFKKYSFRKSFISLEAMITQEAIPTNGTYIGQFDILNYSM